MSKKATTIGGQALIEGIMMKGPQKTALAVRLPSKEIEISYMSEHHAKDKFSPLGWPIIRGVVNFIEAMVSGYKALMLSADKSGFTDLEEDEAPKTPEKEKKESAFMSVLMVVASVVGVALALVLFMWLPALVFNLINSAASGAVTAWRTVIEGILKMSIFVVYIAAVSKMKDIKRVFMYHGAEHKTIFCYESGAELNIENVRKNKRFHPRCGTSFLLIMVIIGIIVNGIIAAVFPAVTTITALWVAIKLLVLPLVCGIGYEIIRICGRYDNKITAVISAPGMWMQRLTTKEPTDDMIEVAIASLNAVKPENPEEDRW